MKKFLPYLLSCLLILTIVTNTSFAEDYSPLNEQILNDIIEEENNDFLVNYLEKFNNSDEKFFIFKDGEIVPDDKKTYIENMIENEDYSNLKNYLEENNISIGYTETDSTLSTMSSNNSEVEPYAIPQEDGSYTQRFYEIATGYWNGKPTTIRKEWTTVLTGKFTLNNKGNIIRTRGATIHIESNFGAAFSPTLENVYASASYRSPNTLICDGGYRLKTTLLAPIGNLGIHIILDFGTVNRSFSKNV